VTRVLVIDDHPIVLQGCRQLLEDAGVENIVQAQSLADGFRLYRVQRPDVIIVDLAMRTGALGGLSFIRRLRLHDQRTPVLVFTMHSDPVIVSRALEVGATGYVLKDTSSEEVLKAFHKVREGRPYLSHDLASEVAFMEARGTTNPLKRMTVREFNGPGNNGSEIRNGVSYNLKPGDVVVIPAGTGHWFTKIDDHISYFMVRIDPDKVAPLKSEAQSKEYLSKPAPTGQ